jgi:Tol biopolymer transport system component
MPAGGSSLASFGGPALNHTYWPRWSPNGKRLAFVSFTRGGQSLEFVNATGTGLVKPARGWFADEPEWSPRGPKLAFVGGGSRPMPRASGRSTLPPGSRSG